jgi:hypothetical protein
MLVTVPELVSPSGRFLPAAGKTRAANRHQAGMTVPHFAPRRACLQAASSGGVVDVLTWRRCRLVEAGFPTELATQLAANPEIDVHELLALVDRGCPPHLAARILDPLPDPWVAP